MPHQYPLFEAHGEPRDLGRQHGEQAATQIDGYSEFLAESRQVAHKQLRQRRLHVAFGNPCVNPFVTYSLT